MVTVAQHAQFALLVQWFSKSSAFSVGSEENARRNLFSSDLLHIAFLHCYWIAKAIVSNLFQFSEARKFSGRDAGKTPIHTSWRAYLSLHFF